MKKLLALAAVLCVAACNKEKAAATVPASLLGPSAATAPEGQTELFTPVVEEPEPVAEAPAPVAVEVAQAIAVIAPTRGNTVAGTVAFRAVDGAVEVTAELRGLAPGAHALRVHAFGDCSAPDAASAGDALITGDLGALAVDPTGAARVTTTIASATLPELLGRAVVIDDQRLGCGVIGVRAAD